MEHAILWHAEVVNVFDYFQESSAAKVAAEKLGQQMENEKQRLRVGGHEAWLGTFLFVISV